jgi:hypothetical protein
MTTMPWKWLGMTTYSSISTPANFSGNLAHQCSTIRPASFGCISSPTTSASKPSQPQDSAAQR